MSKADELLALAQRALELNPEPPLPDQACLDLNRDICAALGWKLRNRTEHLWESPEGKLQQPPLYTTSFDAALMLLPKDHDWQVASVNGGMGGTPFAQVGPKVMLYADTAVLSLVAACLIAQVNLLKVN